MKYFISITLFILIPLSQAYAETGYVTDIFQVTLRKGKSTKQGIVRMLPSGTALKIISKDKKSGYSRVRTPSGKEGWILTRYLMDQPPARARLTRSETRLANNELLMAQIKQELSALAEKTKERETGRSKINEQNLKLSRELTDLKKVSSSAVQLLKDNQRLKKQIVEVEREREFLQQENASLQDRSNRDWFMLGALVVVASMILGIVLTRISWKKKSSWGDL